jgi:cytochrome c-type biogenesis protein CcmF
MLWTMYTSLIGIFLVLHSRSKGYEPEVMTFFGLIELALLLMLIVKDPFLYVWESWPGQVATGFVPVNGRGLNPLLQNYWMVIHPQVLFSGFSSMGVPYAYAMAALLKRDYRNWIRPATPWLVLGATILGTGIMMGGFWAYETLGWGVAFLRRVDTHDPVTAQNGRVHQDQPGAGDHVLHHGPLLDVPHQERRPW